MDELQREIAQQSHLAPYLVAIAVAATLLLIATVAMLRRRRLEVGTVVAVAGGAVCAASVLMPWVTVTSPPIFGQAYRFTPNLFQASRGLGFRISPLLGLHNSSFAWAIYAVAISTTLALVAAPASVRFAFGVVGGLVSVVMGVFAIFAIRWSEFARDAAAPGHVGLGAFALVAGGVMICTASFLGMGRSWDRDRQPEAVRSPVPA